MARHQRMPTLEAGYTYAVEPTVIKQVTCKRGGVHIRTLGAVAEAGYGEPRVPSSWMRPLDIR